MKVLIAGRTKMHGSSRCIGGITESGKSVRLIQARGRNWDSSAPFKIGELWEIDFAALSATTPPHVEDVLVKSYKLLGVEKKPRNYLLARIAPWCGGIDELYDGLVGYTGKNNGYISHSTGLPDRSTWFWTPDQDLVLREDGKHYDYVDGFISKGLSYKGEPKALSTIPGGTLVRVSLARWWKPDDVDDLEERCYLQLSGWL
jgi:hypothetical protein